jgi:hypothetical protein
MYQSAPRFWWQRGSWRKNGFCNESTIERYHPEAARKAWAQTSISSGRDSKARLEKNAAHSSASPWEMLGDFLMSPSGGFQKGLVSGVGLKPKEEGGRRLVLLLIANTSLIVRCRPSGRFAFGSLGRFQPDSAPHGR